MATKIVTKNSSTASAVPTASDLVQGELAVNVADKRLFTENNAGAIVELGTNPSALTVDNNVGIGTSSPAYSLDSVKAGSNIIRVQNSASSADASFYATNTVGTGIFGINATGQYMYGLGNFPLLFYANGSERLRIDSSGNVGIGATSASGSRLRLDNGGTSGAPQLMLTATGASTQTEIRHDTSNNLIFENWNSGRTERMRIDSAGYVTIGSSALSADAGLKFQADTGTFTLAHDRGSHALVLSDSDGTGEVLRVDTSGNLLVGTTDSFPVGSGDTTAGIALRSDGLVCVQSLGAAMVLSRRGSDGGILELRKDGTPVGSIFSGHGGTQVGIGTNTTGITFNPNTRSMMPADPSSTNPQLDATLDIGFSSVRWKDLYLSGGVYLGGTGAANKLDDYEEGIWTPNWAGLGNGTASGTYTKIGRLVHITAIITYGTTTNIGTKLEATNLPFSAQMITYGMSRMENFQSNSYIGATRASGAILRGYVFNTAGSQATELTVSSTRPFTWGTNDYAQLSVTYYTN